MGNNNDLTEEEKSQIGNTIDMLKKRSRGTTPGAKSKPKPVQEPAQVEQSIPAVEPVEAPDPNFTPLLKDEPEERPSQAEVAPEPEPAEEKPPVEEPKKAKLPAKKKKEVTVADDEPVEPAKPKNGGSSLFDDDDFGTSASSGDPAKTDGGDTKPVESKKMPAEPQPREKTQERGLVWSERMKKIGNRYELEAREVAVLSRTETDGTKVKTGASFTIKLSDDSEYGKINAGVELPTCVEDLPEAFQTAWKTIDKELQMQAKGIEESYSD